MNSAGDGGAGNELPWSSVFDSTANMRALSAIQADGFRAASELVDKFVRMASARLGDVGQRGSEHTTQAAEQSADLFGATGLEPFVASWWSMVDQLMGATGPRSEQPPEPDQPSMDLSTASASGRLLLVVAPSVATTAELWLHNRSSADLGKVRLTCSDLLAHDGVVVNADLLHFDPDVVPMPARSSRGVTVQIEVGVETQAGTYRGMLVADGQPELWLPVELIVNPPQQ